VSSNLLLAFSQLRVIGPFGESRETISPNKAGGRVMAPLVSTAAGRLVWMPRLNRSVRLSRPVPASAGSSTWRARVGRRLATAG